MEELFAPPAYEWKRLSPKFRSMRQLTSLIVPPLVLTIPAVIVGVVSGRWWISGLIWVAALVIAIVRFSFVNRSWRSWGYVEREDDLYITHGVMFRSLIAVPYGRMQLVEVESGPLERAFGLAAVTLKTASPETGARIPGLSPEEATRLRDRLTELGEAHASGL
jgi:membrane protein YdbS with pleckstrin-like domain